jgi:putative lipoprotein
MGGRHGIVRTAMKRPPLRTLSVTLASALGAMLLLPVCATVEAQPAPAAAGRTDASGSVLRGSVVYREKDALPDNAQVRVQLVDATPSESAPTIHAETTIPTQGKQVPIAFALPFDPAKLDAPAYTLRAYILLDGKVAYVTRGRVNVNPKAIPASVSVLVVPGNADPVVADSSPPPGAVKAPSPPRRTNQRGAPPQSRSQQQLQLQQQLEQQQTSPPPAPSPPQPKG